MASERIVVIGADAAGMSAAHQALRGARAAGRTIEVIVLEQTFDTSYSACGLPYLIGGAVGSTDDLTARTADEHRAAGVDLRLGAEATAIDPDAGSVGFRTLDGSSGTVGYDQLVLATGARPIVPDWASDPGGQPIEGVHPVKNLDDARYWLTLLSHIQGGRAVIVGGGYIGVEMAEALLQRGFAVTLLTRGRVMSSLDPELSDRVAAALTEAGVDVLTDTTVASAVTTGGTVRALVTEDGREYPADVVVLGLGLRPAADLGAAVGISLGEHGGYLPDPSQRIGAGLWAAGDCCEVRDRLRDAYTFVPLGTHANKQGRVCGANLVGGTKQFRGVLGTAITRFQAGTVELEIARTGLSTDVARTLGFDPLALITEGTTTSGYLPGHAPIATNVIADQRDRRLLGMQITGGAGAGKRIDTAAAALWGGMTIDDLAEMDLSYAPPFATVWEAVQLAARRLAERLP